MPGAKFVRPKVGSRGGVIGVFCNYCQTRVKLFEGKYAQRPRNRGGMGVLGKKLWKGSGLEMN